MSGRDLPVPVVNQILRYRAQIELFEAYARLLAYSQGLGVRPPLRSMIRTIREIRPSPEMVAMLRLRVSGNNYPGRTFSPLRDLNLFLRRRWGIAMPHPRNPYNGRVNLNRRR